MRRILHRLPLFRTIVPRVTRPILPVTSRILPSPEIRTTRTLTGSLRISPFRTLHTTTPARLSSSSSSSPPPNNDDDVKAPGSLSQRLKTLMKAYGWYAVGMYAAVSVIDFAAALAGIHLLGADYVASVAASAKAWLLGLVYSSSRPPEPGRDEMEEMTRGAVNRGGVGGGQEGLYAMLVLAYIVHKMLLPVRIGLTAVLTPRFVNWLRVRGWTGGEGTRRALQEMKERLRDRD